MSLCPRETLILAAIGAAVTLAGCGGEGRSPADRVIPGEPHRMVVHPVTDRSVDEGTGFTSPSGNIGCYVDPESVRCDIGERDWAPPPRPADCPEFTDFGQGVTLDAGGAAGFVCAGDTVLNSGPPLAYGDTITAGPVRCESTSAGIRCWDFVRGGGFSLSRERYSLS